MVSATLPVPIYLMLVLWIDRYEAEPAWMLATAFFWGALVAVFFAFLINTASDSALQLMAKKKDKKDQIGAFLQLSERKRPAPKGVGPALLLFARHQHSTSTSLAVFNQGKAKRTRPRAPPKRTRLPTSSRLSFVTINPKHQHEVDGNRQCG